MNNSAPRVLVFDSGVGSLSIGREIHSRLPALNLLYALDSAGFPYGEWDENKLTEHICTTVMALVEQTKPDLMVLACNSASTAVLPALRQKLSIPVVGVVPAIKPAAKLSRSGVIGLLATPGTVRRPYTAQLITDFAQNCTVISVGNAELAPAIERLYWSGDQAESLYARIADTFAQHPRCNEMDTLVLACTHFPLIAGELSEHFPGVRLIDSGEAIARRVEQLLAPQTGGGHAEQRALIIGDRPFSETFRQRLQALGIEHVVRISVR